MQWLLSLHWWEPITTCLLPTRSITSLLLSPPSYPGTHVHRNGKRNITVSTEYQTMKRDREVSKELGTFLLYVTILRHPLFLRICSVISDLWCKEMNNTFADRDVRNYIDHSHYRNFTRFCLAPKQSSSLVYWE